ncbi:MBL fold metallo-hydrolase [Gordonia sp. ABSL11-1]|uniref:MBL fold metallo-hydrolase n=1 Tax=Gordonia sp. ABSL11-1 TaxID=3053924 RepID=UPI002572B170|nr:MBL fold metallo-hydrolase [Gordonia sp. ABSL11-1]MDL9947433.1 MBL fold metallo-hydrolase [Gordonia sp. ABSL11-1]
MSLPRERDPRLGEVLTAVGHMVLGTVRPRPPDERLMQSITDAGLPPGERTVTIRALPQVTRRVPAMGVVEGAAPVRRLGSALTSFVVEHPAATFLVDPGFCRQARDRVLPELPFLTRTVVTPPRTTVSTVDGLIARPSIRRPEFALPTHAHWDHLCGLLDLPGVPVLLRDTEHAWILDGVRPPAGGVRPTLTDGRPVRTYCLDGPPVSTFTASHDLFDDGSVVLVDLAGHTPGSVGVLARTARGWVLLAGDAAWHHEQVDRLRQKPAFPGEFVDDDRDAAFATLHRLHLARHHIRVVPTHDSSVTMHLCG